MENKEELELLREFFDGVGLDKCKGKDLLLFDKILKIQKQNKLKDRIIYIQRRLSVKCKKEFNEILKELGYEH